MQNADVIRLSELAGLVWQAIDGAFNQQLYWVIADVANHTSNTGRYYFTLSKTIPPGRPSSQNTDPDLGGWGEKIRAFEEMTGQGFTRGLKVLVQVSVFYHAVHGLQLTLLAIDANFTLGAMERERKETLLRLIRHNYVSFDLRKGLMSLAGLGDAIRHR